MKFLIINMVHKIPKVIYKLSFNYLKIYLKQQNLAESIQFMAISIQIVLEKITPIILTHFNHHYH